MSLQTPCDFAKARYVDIGLLRKLWGRLLFILGVSVTLFLSIAIVFFLRSKWLPSALSVLGTIMNGAAMKWITTQRKIAAEEEVQAFHELVQQCGGTTQAMHCLTTGLEDPLTKMVESSWFQEVEAARQSSQEATRFLAKLRGE